jgi:hypothetical protein
MLFSYLSSAYILVILQNFKVDLIISMHFTQYKHGRVLLLSLETKFVKKQL